MSGPQTVSAVLFDLDGTLIDSAPDLGAAAEKMRTDRGLKPLGLDVYRPMAGAGARGMLSVAFGIEPDHTDYDALKDEFLCNYEQCLLNQTRAFEGVAELLNVIRALGLRWGIVTNKIQRFTSPLVRQLPLLAAADVVISGDTTPHPKPHPAPLLEAACRLAVPAGHCVYVGDDERDIVAGRAAGMRTLAACYGYLGANPSSVGSWGADAVVETPLDILKWLELP